MGESFAMNGGDGAYSYTRNSQYQKQASDSVKDMIQKALIENLDTEVILQSISNTVSIADLGCSVGPNTFSTVQTLMQAVENKFGEIKDKLEFQVFFNDHSANDFNTLLAAIPPNRQYYAAAVSGSFHGRLFPRASITVAHSSYALQWLSKQPQGMLPNEGRIHYTEASEDLMKAYSEQFERDLGVFMSARAEEIVSGGLLLLIMPGIPDGVSHSQLPAAVMFSFLGHSLVDLAKEGVVDKAKIDEFNLPIYGPRVGEMRRLIEKNGCFSIEKIEVMNPRSHVEGAIDAGRLIMHMRAGMEGIFSAHFGKVVVEKMFIKLSEKAQEMSHLLESAYDNPTQLFLVLKRQ